MQWPWLARRAADTRAGTDELSARRRDAAALKSAGNARFVVGDPEMVKFVFGRYLTDDQLTMSAVYTEDLNFGFTTMDNLASALLTIFQAVTLEGWVDVMYVEMAVLGPAVALYFVLFVMLGSFYLISALLPATPHGAA